MKFFKNVKNNQTNNAGSLLTIDFSKPWWSIFVQQKKDIAIVVLTTLFSNILITLFPKLISWSIETQSFIHLVFTVGLYLFDESMSWFVWGPHFMRLYIQTSESFRYSAYKTLLTFDPVYHAQQSSGVTLGKIRRTTEAYKDLIKTCMDDFIPLVISLLTMLVLFWSYDIVLAISTSFGLLILSIIFSSAAVLITRSIERQANLDDDRASHIDTESVVQARFIRATFASNQISERLRSSHSKSVHSSITFLRTYRFMRGLFIFTYTLCIGFTTGYLIYLMQHNIMTASTALALVMTIINSTYPLLKLDKRVRETFSAYRKIVDFYHFIHSSGKRSYPVYNSHLQAGEAPQIHAKDPITLDITNVTVAYPHHKPLFSDISLHITASHRDPYKLFGIIGPSGIGKTTLLLLLGGQLKPIRGSIIINGYDIYAISDRERQQLIALQGQIATGLHETLHYNLTFGLPIDHGYSHEDLIELLEAVGLWSIFKHKKGLQTLVGEGGTALSGGQRQRLNFANLYLRAKTYKPAVILIDEPTSSLDEISEQKITELINQLAQTSLTLVIAHRLKTLENASKIADFCMLVENNILAFYTHEELKEKSNYYQELLAGTTIMHAEHE